MPTPRPLRLLLLGAPGSGKGTQTNKLLRRFPYIKSISSGDLLRQHIQQKTEIGRKASESIEQGRLLSDELIASVVVNNLEDRGWLNKSSTWLLDGFPRTLGQAQILDDKLENCGASLNLVVELDVPDKVILSRIKNRYVHIPSGRIYNLEYNPPKIAGRDDITGEPLSKRPDDTAEIFSKRLNEYLETVNPLKKYYEKQGIMFTISGDTSDIISPQLISLIEKEFGKSIKSL